MINNILFAILFFILGLFLKEYLPSYMKEKGKNLATKEDIKDITNKIESTKHIYNTQLSELSINLQHQLNAFGEIRKFKKDYYFSQYKELYVKLYAVILQSEYVRVFLNYTEPMKDLPFIELEMSSKKSILNLANLRVEEISSVELANELTEYNKITIANLIIEKSEYATPELLKLAIAYRFIHRFYQDETLTPDDDSEDPSLHNKFSENEVELIYGIVKRIIKDYNSLRRDSELEYNESEISSMKIDWSILDNGK